MLKLLSDTPLVFSFIEAKTVFHKIKFHFVEDIFHFEKLEFCTVIRGNMTPVPAVNIFDGVIVLVSQMA